MHISDEILLNVTKPGRYSGGELNAIVKPGGAPINFAFCFPDVYEVGMSHLGLQILYFFINRRRDACCQRAFMPWPDMEALMRGNDLPLYALETGTPLRDFDMLGFTLQFELSYTNVLAMLDLAGLPLRSSERGEDMPVVCAGGPCACNPEPLAEFIDFFYIGDGEAALDEILDNYRENKNNGGGKQAFLESVAGLPGVYVPAFYDAEYDENGLLLRFAPNRPSAPATVKRAVVSSLDAAFFPDKFIVPWIETVHDRAMLEIFRGCIRGCRFCQAGFLYRPVRERSPETLFAQAGELLSNTGHEEISLVSLAACDHSRFENLVDGLLARCSPEKVNISLPSLRVDAMSLSVLQKTQTVRKSSLTFAPEAGSQRLRDVINKNLSEDDILDGCFRAFEAGFDRVKLYFMAGLPTETDEDVAGIARLAERVVDQYYKLPYEQRRRPVSVSVSASCFVPKPFTPFQWAAQDELRAFNEKQRAIKDLIRKKQISYRYHDAPSAVVEGVLARGGRPLAAAIERAYRLGAKFDGWSEHFNFEIWQNAFKQSGIDTDFRVHRERQAEEIFPWDFIDIGVSKKFLRREWERGMEGKTTPNCREGCAGCGMAAFAETAACGRESNSALSLRREIQP
ncbi:MAG: TIGR03960 family B12-binding radical SAM protein [Clostridiales bacterium]|jgi:radical SAM family uncharacterized protein|nr:TIGR03960 family B12-binding radical SAM protein [Clostridiales bacterium]